MNNRSNTHSKLQLKNALDCYDIQLTQTKKGLTASRHKPFFKWSGREDLNLRPPAPKAGALARLRHAPIIVNY